MSLEEIIAAGKKSKSGRNVGGFRSDGVKKSNKDGARPARSGGARNFGKFSDNVPSGKWKHDKFEEGNSSGRRGAIGDRVSAASSTANPNKKVHVNLSNLGPTVVSADLEELFDNYEPEMVTVHFNEHGESLGTGSVYLKKKDALQALQDFKGVSLDGHLLKMVILDGTTAVAGTSIKSRLQFTSPRTQSNLKVSSRGGVQKKHRSERSGERTASHFLDRIVDDAEPKSRGGNRQGGGGRGGAKGGREKKVQKTEAELDAELDSYMKRNKPMDM